MWFKRFWVLMLSCRATLNFLPFCVTGWVLVPVEVLGWFIKHSLLVFPCSIIWPCLCSIMELAAILISEAGLWLPTCFSAACSVSSATSLWLRIFRNTPTLLNQAEFKRCWSLMLLCRALLNFRHFCAKTEAWLVSVLVRVFLSIRTTIKEAVCFILESHNWHLHIGSWNRGSSQRSQGIWQSEQFSHREQGIFALHTSLQLLALWNHNSTWGQGGVGMRQRSYWKHDLRPPSPVWREAAVWMFIWAVSKTLFTFLTTLKSLSRLLSRRSHRKLMNAWLMAVDLWWKEAVASSIWVHSSVIRAADCRSAGPLSRPAFWLSRNKQR